MNETSNDIFADLDEEAHHRRSPWSENRGNFLAGFTILIVFVGSGILACRQLRFVPPRFPDARSIQTPDPSLIEVPDDLVESPDDEVPPKANSTAATTSQTTTSENAGEKAKITLIATGAADTKGNTMFAIYDSAQNFNKIENAVRRQKSSIQGGRSAITLAVADLPERFAVAVYHDRNGNGSLDRNAFGIPSERYGFSNNARSLTGPPAFSKAVVDRPEAGGRIEIQIR